LKLAEAHRLSTGKGVIVAVIDAAIDKDHPDSAGAVIEEFDAGCGPDARGTARGNMIVGAIAARRNLLGVAPDAKILAICAFHGTGITDNIIKGIDYAIARGATHHQHELCRAGRSAPARGAAEGVQ
jgi:subtilisin family serine protease